MKPGLLSRALLVLCLGARLAGATEPNPPATEPDPHRTEPDRHRTEPDRHRTEPDRHRTEPDRHRVEPDPPATEPDPDRTEFGVLPALSYGSDSGLGVGVLLGLVKFEPQKLPYRWRVETLLSANLRVDDAGNVDTPFHQDYVSFDLPNLWKNRLRLSGRVAFERESDAAYFGLGNASARDAARLVENPRAYQYDHIGPSLRLAARLRLATTKATRLEGFVAPMLDWNWVNTYAQSALTDDLQNGELDLAGGTTHGLLVGAAGVIWDGRNHESAPTRGFYSQLTLRAGAGIDEKFSFGGLTLEQRVFVPIWEPYFVLAGRFMADFIVGNAPFYELSRGGGLIPVPMGGGARSVRGLFKERYAGPIKFLANLELRGVFASFTVLRQRIKLGALGFLDGVRVVSDLGGHPELDGTDLGIKLGAGGGARIHWGEHFVVRCDVAYSPTDDTRGFYLGVHHIF